MASKTRKKGTDVSSKKDKKKDKKKNKETSITDVIAVELMEKAKKTLELDPKLKKEETPSPPACVAEKEPPTPPKINEQNSTGSEKEPEDDEFDIPTISEISGFKITSGGGQILHKKELSQLQELQNRIYQTKKKLKDMSSESEEDTPVVKNSVLKRLGVKPRENSKPSNIISLSEIRRTEKEIYVAPSFRKLIEKQKQENDRKDDGGRRPARVAIRRDRRSRSRSRSRERYERSRNRRDRSRSPINRLGSPNIRPTIHSRIGSRVVVASPDKEPQVKVKQRPTLSSAITARAGKNLLLRAVAEAQRSTANATEPRKRLPRENIVVQVPLRKDRRNIRKDAYDEEYVPESISTQSESEAEYHPSYNKVATQEDGDDGDVIYLNNNEDVDLEDLDNDEGHKSPQFVVTLEGAVQFENNSKSSHSPTPPPVIKRKSIKDRIGLKPVVNVREERPPVKRTPEDESESQRAYKRAKRRLSPIKFDLTDEEENDSDRRKSRQSSRDTRSRSPRKKDNGEKERDEQDEHAKRIKLEPSRSFDHVPART